jgi:lipid-A-disaccharide synthase-like uncharacterized protein
MFAHALSWLTANHTSCLTTDHLWELVGYCGTVLFASRFFVQWFKSEMEGRSVIPVAFWYFSLGGGLISLVYAIHIQSGPFIVGQAGGLVVYFRNLYLIFREKAHQRRGVA